MISDATTEAEVQEKFERFSVDRDNEDLRNELVEAHLGIAQYLAGRFTHRGEPLDDLVQVASMALLKAVNRYEPERNVKFSTFATHTIVGELKRHFRDKGWAVRAPRRMQELYLNINKASSDLSHELNRSPSIIEIAKAVDASEEEVLEAIEAGQAYRFSSLDAPTNRDDGDETVGSRVGADDPRLTDAEDRIALSPLVHCLPQREQTILQLRFFEGLTQAEIAERLGVSQMHVSRLLSRSLSRLRDQASA